MGIKKIILLLVLTIILTGCNAEYNLEIKDGKVYEVSSFREEREKLGNNFQESEQTIKQVIDDAYDNFHDKNNLQEEEKTRSFLFSRINEEKFYGIEYKNEFEIDKYNDSPVIDQCYDEVKVTTENNILKISTNEYFKCYDFYEDLNIVTINITTNNKVKKNNADKIKNNTYTWTVTKDNAKNKKIVFEVDTTKKGKAVDKKIVIIGVGGVFALMIIAILVSKRKNN